MSKQSRLVYIATLTGSEESPDVISVSEDGIPVGWILCFGGRNFWEPDEKVEERGGASAKRDPFITPLEVAEARLHNAMETFRASEHLWVWYASLEMLRRRIMATGRKGFLRLEAPWATKNKSLRECLTQAPACAENYVNYLAGDKFARLGAAAKPLEEVSPFVPLMEESDLKRFRKLRAYGSLSEPARAAAVIIGLPGKDPGAFEQNVQANYREEFEKINSLPPYPKPQKKAAAPATTPKPIPDSGGMKISKAEKPSFFSRVKALLGRR